MNPVQPVENEPSLSLINRIRQAVGKAEFRPWTVPLALLALCVLGFGLLLPQLGFYWDDWAKMLVSRVFGLSGYWAYYAEDRPFSGWTHIVLTPLLGAGPLGWHLFSLVLRWLTAWGMWWAFSLLWPRARRPLAFAAALFAVYPVFTQQAVSVTFHQQWMQYALYFLSLGLMLQAARRPPRFRLFSGLSLLAMVVQLSITEYFVGLELLRPALLWILWGEVRTTFGQRAWKTLRSWAPYLLLLAAYVIWRLFFIQLTGEDPYRAETLYNLIEAPKATLLKLAFVIFVDTFDVIFTTWAGPLDIGLGLTVSRFTVFVWALALVAAAALAIYLSRLRETEPEMPTAGRDWLYQALAIGLLAILLGCLPAWITDRHVIDDFHANRYAMPAMFGAALIWAALLWQFVPRRGAQALVLSAAIGLALVFHLRISDSYRQIWTNQVDFYWQLSWRAPYLEPGTAVISEEELFPNQGGFSTAAAINLMYPQPQEWPTLAYWYYSLRPRFVPSAAKPLGIPLRTQFRTLTFSGVTPDSVMVYYDPGRSNCMWMLGPYDQDDPDVPELMRQMLAISNLERVQPQATVTGYPPTEMIGAEPAHDWCYLYQKADLARQLGDWAQVVALGDQARQQLGHGPADPYFKTPHEWLVFIEGYAHLGRWQEAQELTLAVAERDPQRYEPNLCRLWARIAADTSADAGQAGALAALQDSLSCEW